MWKCIKAAFNNANDSTTATEQVDNYTALNFALKLLKITL